MAPTSGVKPAGRNETPSSLRNRIGVGLLAVAFALLIVAIVVAMRLEGKSQADPDDTRQVALGKSVYERSCASCHGAMLEGQANWREKLPSGRLPAPPHDASGHTWHHPDSLLFGMIKQGLLPGKYAPVGYESDMPAFAETLSDQEIWAVLAYIKSSWPPHIHKAQQKVTRDQKRR